MERYGTAWNGMERYGAVWSGGCNGRCGWAGNGDPFLDLRTLLRPQPRHLNGVHRLTPMAHVPNLLVKRSGGERGIGEG